MSCADGRSVIDAMADRFLNSHPHRMDHSSHHGRAGTSSWPGRNRLRWHQSTLSRLGRNTASLALSTHRPLHLCTGFRGKQQQCITGVISLDGREGEMQISSGHCLLGTAHLFSSSPLHWQLDTVAWADLYPVHGKREEVG